LRRTRHTNTYRDTEWAIGAVDAHTLDSLAYRFSHGGGLSEGRRRQQHGKLFTTIARKNTMVRTQQFRQPSSHGTQAVITDNVTMVVVEMFEVINIDHQNRKTHTPVAYAIPQGEQLLIEPTTIGDARERIGDDKIFQLALQTQQLTFRAHALALRDHIAYAISQDRHSYARRRQPGSRRPQADAQRGKPQAKEEGAHALGHIDHAWSGSIVANPTWRRVETQQAQHYRCRQQR